MEQDLLITKIIDIRRDAHIFEKPYIQRPPRNWNTIVFYDKNDSIVTIPNHTIYCSEGDVFFFRSEILNRGESVKKAQGSYIYINFNTSDDDIFNKSPFQPFVHLSSRIDFENDFYNILSLWNNREAGYMVYCRELLYRILGNMLQNMVLYKTVHHQHSRIKKAVAYINNHYMDNISIDDLAQLCNLSAKQLSRYFVKLYNKTPHKFLMDVRFKAAVSFLQNTEISVKEIAERTGYENVYSFHKAFKKIYGVPPGKFPDK